MSDWPRVPAICRDRIAVGTDLERHRPHLLAEAVEDSSQTASVASGVTSRRAGPVPPVVTTRQQPSRSHSSRSVVLDQRLFVRDQAGHRLPRARQDFRQAVADRRAATVLVDALAGAVGDGHDADADRGSHKRTTESQSKQTQRKSLI